MLICAFGRQFANRANTGCRSHRQPTTASNDFTGRRQIDSNRAPIQCGQGGRANHVERPPETREIPRAISAGHRQLCGRRQRWSSTEVQKSSDAARKYLTTPTVGDDQACIVACGISTRLDSYALQCRPHGTARSCRNTTHGRFADNNIGGDAAPIPISGGAGKTNPGTVRILTSHPLASTHRHGVIKRVKTGGIFIASSMVIMMMHNADGYR